MNAFCLAGVLTLLPTVAVSGLTYYGVTLNDFVAYQPSTIVALHHGRQALIGPGEMSFTPKLWLGGANRSSDAIRGGFGFAYEGAINATTGFGVALGAYDGTGNTAGIAASVRRNGSPSPRTSVALQAALGYQWSVEAGDDVFQIPNEFGELRGEYLVRDASWTTVYVHAVGDYRLGPLRPTLDVGVLFARSSVRGSPRTGPDFAQFELDLVDVESRLRLTGGGGLALVLGPLDAYMGSIAYDGGGAFVVSGTITVR